MQITEFDLKKIFESVWGYSAPPFLFGLQNRIEKHIGYNQDGQNSDFQLARPIERRESNIKGSPFYALNQNGNEVFLPIWLIKPDGQKLLLQNTVSSMISKKTIVETPMVNRRGNVKELIAIEDWEINVKGIIVSSDYDYPDETVAELNDLYLLNEPLGIENARMSLVLELDKNEKSNDLKSSEMVVIKELRLPELKGMKNIQPFELNLITDFGFELIIE